MNILRFGDFFKKQVSETNKTNEEYEFHFEINDFSPLNENLSNREYIDDVLYGYVCNYKDDATFDGVDALTVEGLIDYINEDETLTEETRKSLEDYIYACDESVEDTFEELLFG